MNELVTENPELAANDLVMAKQMAETLHSHYPGHAWAVTCDGATGIATVRNLALSGNWGFTLKLTTTYSASEFRRRIVMAGGGALLRGLPQVVEKATGLHTRLADDPLTCVARGGGRALEMIDLHGSEFFSPE